jgi:hypothetical protein
MIITGPGNVTVTLHKNMVFEGSGYAIDNSINWGANDVVDINLNGYTLTFGEGTVNQTKALTYAGYRDGNVAHSAVVCPADPRANQSFGSIGYPFDWGASGRTMPRVRIRNGTIRTGAGGGLSYANCIDISAITDADVGDLTLEITADDSQGVVMDGCYCHDVVATLTNVGVFNPNQGMSVFNAFRGGDTAFGVAEIANNTITGTGGHIGITTNTGSLVYGNDITRDTTVKNGYGIVAVRDGAKVYRNTINAAPGRGIQLNGRVTTFENVCNVQHESGMEFRYAHGLKIEQDAADACYSFGGTYTATGNTGNMGTAPLSLDMYAESGVVVEDTKFVALQGDGILQWVHAVEQTDGSGLGSVIRRCHMESDGYAIQVTNYSDAADDYEYRDCVFEKTGVGASDFVAVFSSNNASQPAFRLVDCSFPGYDERTAKRTVGHNPNSYQVEYTAQIANCAHRLLKTIDAEETVVTSVVGAACQSGVDLVEFSNDFDGTSATIAEKTPHWVMVDGLPHKVEATARRHIFANRQIPLMAVAG